MFTLACIFYAIVVDANHVHAKPVFYMHAKVIFCVSIPHFYLVYYLQYIYFHETKLLFRMRKFHSFNTEDILLSYARVNLPSTLKNTVQVKSSSVLGFGGSHAQLLVQGALHDRPSQNSLSLDADNEIQR